MRLLDVLCIELWRELTRIYNLHSVVIDGKTDTTVSALILAMTEGICQCLAKCFNRNLEFLLS